MYQIFLIIEIIIIENNNAKPFDCGLANINFKNWIK